MVNKTISHKIFRDHSTSQEVIWPLDEAGLSTLIKIVKRSALIENWLPGTLSDYGLNTDVIAVVADESTVSGLVE